MKTLLLSDVHANVVALEAIRAKERDADRIYCAGDLVDWGPFPREVIAWMQAHDVIGVRGNHDDVVIKRARSGEAAAARAACEAGGEITWMDHNASLLTETEIAYLEALPLARPIEIDGVTYGLTHLYRGYEEIVSLAVFDEFSRTLFPGAARGEGVKRMIFGHTHRQAIRHLAEDRLWLNPGSISYRRPDDPDQTAHYALIEDGRLSLKRLDYDRRPVMEAVAATRLTTECTRSVWFFGDRK